MNNHKGAPFTETCQNAPLFRAGMSGIHIVPLPRWPPARRAYASERRDKGLPARASQWQAGIKGEEVVLVSTRGPAACRGEIHFSLTPVSPRIMYLLLHCVSLDIRIKPTNLDTMLLQIPKGIDVISFKEIIT
jgi:hypothetical protein